MYIYLYRSAFSIPLSLSSIFLISCQMLLYGLKCEHVHALALTLCICVFSKRLNRFVLYRFVGFFSFSPAKLILEGWIWWKLTFLKRSKEKRITAFVHFPRSKTRESVNFEWHCTSIFSFIYFSVGFTTSCPSHQNWSSLMYFRRSK